MEREERRLFHIKNGEIEYHGVGNELWYSYEERSETQLESGARRLNIYRAQGLIPFKVMDQGEEAIQVFVKLLVDEKINSDKELRKLKDEYMKRLRHPLEIDYRDVLLKGHLRSDDGTKLSADLFEPYQDTYGVSFNMFSARSGHYIYRGNPPYFSDYAIDKGRDLIISAYHRAKVKAENPEVTKISMRLNNLDQ